MNFQSIVLLLCCFGAPCRAAELVWIEERIADTEDAKWDRLFAAARDFAAAGTLVAVAFRTDLWSREAANIIRDNGQKINRLYEVLFNDVQPKIPEIRALIEKSQAFVAWVNIFGKKNISAEKSDFSPVKPWPLPPLIPVSTIEKVAHEYRSGLQLTTYASLVLACTCMASALHNLRTARRLYQRERKLRATLQSSKAG